MDERLDRMERHWCEFCGDWNRYDIRIDECRTGTYCPECDDVEE